MNGLTGREGITETKAMDVYTQKIVLHTFDQIHC